MPNVFYIPSGPKNLSGIFPAINWDNVKSYTLTITDGSATIATTPLFKMCCSGEEGMRLHFENSAGGTDAVDFYKPHVTHEDTAMEFQNSLNYPLDKLDTGTERYNIKSNDTYEAKHKCNESDMPWLRELADSPKIYLEWIGTESQEDAYIPVVKIAGKFDKLKNDQEWNYEFVIQVKLSNTYITQRN